ncbi:MAG: hypothetical protein Q7U73_14110 [Rubrivivax sp.]|nr:hypothetical protein [Rubrivivax sp.]
MTTTPAMTLLGAVRRRLWLWQFMVAVRRALWGSAGLMLLAVVVHLAARPIPAGVVVWTLAMLWASMLALAVWERPADPACALWVDRHLDGASAFSTLLDLGQGRRGTANAQAVRWLEEWAAAKVPDSLRLLNERRQTVRLARPLLSMMVCTALAALVLALPGLAPSPQRGEAESLAAARPASAEIAVPVVEAPVATELVSELANDLRSALPRDKPERREAGRAPVAGAGQPDAGQSPATSPTGATPAGEGPAARAATAVTAVDAAPRHGSSQVSGAGSGREAGDSRDDPAGVGVSRMLRGTMSVQWSETTLRRASSPRQADMDRLAAYDEDFSMPGPAASLAHPTAAAAAPPAATGSTRLRPSEAAYVQAWLKASASRP